ncbi:hypothetical protein AA0313_1345 [Acetobacter indonesiensis NRIC 0313]|uniref:Uncharacterized protein n=1 Tax=Acetobacter indonesiensis TaxID=104101 RepID=A0A6N3T5H8_9PROT|nr:hypothetical protein Abin_004_004 [Acetobacter indonesiensis]GBQ57053.1 hypothetical protein AA0313_1345 [Acetobacter indonesiensis NRIC 0313]GEN04551.1 hypothetical protein AIN02nite_25760 [Acetobacter indonesiensis]
MGIKNIMLRGGNPTGTQAKAGGLYTTVANDHTATEKTPPSRVLKGTIEAKGDALKRVSGVR